MALPIVLTSIADKRARYVAEAEYHQKRADQAREAIAKLDAALSLWEGSAQLPEVRRLYRPHPGNFKWGELARMVVAFLQASPDGLTTTEAQYLIAERKGLLGDVEELRRLSRRVTAALNDKRRDGVLVKDGKRGGLIVFRIAQDGEGVVCPQRAAETVRRNAERSLARLERRRDSLSR
jgi:hypothetical protein